jgi:hypothetical protein
MAANTKNKFPADRSGSKYAEFRNTRRVSQNKAKEVVKQSAASEANSAKTGQS